MGSQSSLASSVFDLEMKDVEFNSDFEDSEVSEMTLFLKNGLYISSDFVLKHCWLGIIIECAFSSAIILLAPEAAVHIS